MEEPESINIIKRLKLKYGVTKNLYYIAFQNSGLKKILSATVVNGKVALQFGTYKLKATLLGGTSAQIDVQVRDKITKKESEYYFTLIKK